MAADPDVQDEKDDWGWGIVVNYHKKSARDDVVVTSEGVGSRYIVDVLLHCAPAASNAFGHDTGRPVPAPLNAEGEMRVLPVLLPVLDGMSQARISLARDLKPVQNRREAKKNLKIVVRAWLGLFRCCRPTCPAPHPFYSWPQLKQFKSELPILVPAPLEEGKDPEFVALKHKVVTVQEHIESNPLQSADDRDVRFEAFKHKLALEEEVQHLKREIKATQNLMLRETCKKMMRVLRRLGHTDAKNVVQLKGRVACEINTADELLVTELMFNGAFNDLDAAQCVRACRCARAP